MKFQIFTRKKQPKETVDIERRFAEICARYESQLRNLSSDWTDLCKKWDLVLNTVDEALRNATDVNLLENPMEEDNRKFFVLYQSVTKSLKKELKKANKATTKSERKLLKKKSKMWLKEVLGTSELSRGFRFLQNQTVSRSLRYSRKWNKFEETKRKSSKLQKKVELERNRERIRLMKREEESKRTSREREEEIRLTCKTCGHAPAERKAQEEKLKVIQKALSREMKIEGRKRRAEQGMAEALRWNLKFGEAAQVEMNVRQKEQNQSSFLQWFRLARCAECQFPHFPKF
jgi:hypothetical protein